MRHHIGAVLSIVLIAATFGPGITMASEANDVKDAGPSADAIVAAQAERAAFGLPSDEATVTALLGSANDVGTPEWGIALTAAEASAIDLPGRSQFGIEIRDKALPYAQAMPDFGGAYLDTAANGELVVILTKPDPAAEDAIEARMPDVSRGLRFIYRSITDRDLKASLHRTETQWDAVLPEVHLERAMVDLPGGGITVEVAAADVSTTQKASNALSAALGAPVAVRAARSNIDTTCTRDNCINPFKAGIRLYKGVIDTHAECTLGWTVVTWGGDGQFVTSGHCGYTGSNSWLHPGLPGTHVIGSEQATDYRNNGHDVMRVSMADAQLGYDIYAETRHTWSTSYPIVGDTVYDSRGYQNIVDGGTVSSSDVRWYSDTAGYYVYGGGTNGIAQVGGDSGSPLYMRYTSTNALAVGIVDTSGGNFTIAADIESYLGVYINLTP